jgi:uncharacterized membrane protein
MVSKLIKGTAGHPLHPPLTDATIGMFALAAGLAVVGSCGGLGDVAGKAMWLALVGGLILALPTAATGLADWLSITRGTPLWRTATSHLLAMVTAVAVLGVAAWQQWSGWHSSGEVTLAALVLTLVGVAVLTLGGWLGGTLVFVHGMRVLGLADAPALEAAKPESPELRDEAA